MPTKKTTAPETNAALTVKVLGFSRTPSGLRLNTSPSLDIWVNSKQEYETYRSLIGTDAQFTSRTVRTRNGGTRKVYDLNITELDEADLDTLFEADRFEPATTTNQSDRPF